MSDPGMNFASAPQSATEYCRTVRRLRGQFSERPVALHAALRDLGDRRDAMITTHAPAPLTIYSNPDPAAHFGRRADMALFVQRVRAAFDGDVLRYSQRAMLLEQADELNIGRFEANLAIAMVQHYRATAGDSEPAQIYSMPAQPSRSGNRLAALAQWIAVATVAQASLLAAAWWLLR